MPNIVVTGIGLITCIGSDKETVIKNLKELKTGIQAYAPFDKPKIPIHVAAPLEHFNTQSTDPEDWAHPGNIRFRLDQLRSLSPHGLYSIYALEQALEDANLSLEAISNPETGLFCASGGSPMMTHHHLSRMDKVGPMRISPLGIVSSIAGTLNFNLVSRYKIKGSSTGFVSACASSGHAMGYAFDEIKLGRQERMIVVGAEDFSDETILPFASMRVLSQSKDPLTASRPFDKNRDGFVGTGGAAVLIFENEEVAKARGAKIYAQLKGWGQSTDGHHVAIAHPEGEGLQRAMKNALKSAELEAQSIDYINAHATSTKAGDIAELKAIKQIFGKNTTPQVSSTKALTGHALSLSSIMEAAFTTLSIAENFTPGSAHISELDKEAEGVNILHETSNTGPNIAMSNSSGFGGANVSIVLAKK